jgi:hypothetical protein
MRQKYSNPVTLKLLRRPTGSGCVAGGASIPHDFLRCRRSQGNEPPGHKRGHEKVMATGESRWRYKNWNILLRTPLHADFEVAVNNSVGVSSKTLCCHVLQYRVPKACTWYFKIVGTIPVLNEEIIWNRQDIRNSGFSVLFSAGASRKVWKVAAIRA